MRSSGFKENTRTDPRLRRITPLAGLVIGLVAVGSVVAATPVQGSIVGPVASVRNSTFAVKTSLSPTGSSLVKTNAKTVIARQTVGKKADLKAGVCVVATGQKDSKGVVAAQRIAVSKPVKSACGTAGITPPGGGAGSAGTPPQPPNGGQVSANAGVAAGKVATSKGSTVTVKGRDGKKTTVIISSKTAIQTSTRVKASQIAVQECAFVRGTSADRNVSIVATNVSLSKPVNGSCRPGRPQGNGTPS